ANMHSEVMIFGGACCYQRARVNGVKSASTSAGGEVRGSVHGRRSIAKRQSPLITVLMPAEYGLYAVALQNRHDEIPDLRALQIGLGRTCTVRGMMKEND